MYSAHSINVKKEAVMRLFFAVLLSLATTVPTYAQSSDQTRTAYSFKLMHDENSKLTALHIEVIEYGCTLRLVGDGQHHFTGHEILCPDERNHGMIARDIDRAGGASVLFEKITKYFNLKPAH